jgi:hypothetical protein
VLWFGYGPVAGRLAGAGSLHDVAVLVVLGAIGAAIYGGTIWLFFGRAWLAAFRAKRRG